jgi:hypothetical protein
MVERTLPTEVVLFAGIDAAAARAGARVSRHAIVLRLVARNQRLHLLNGSIVSATLEAKHLTAVALGDRPTP